MGFNIAGIVVNENYENRVEKLREELGLNLTFAEEITVEEASRNWKEEGVFDICFIGHATVIFISHADYMESCSMADNNVFTFAVSETSDAYMYSYSERMKQKRFYMSMDDGTKREDGEPLAVEKGTNYPVDVVWKMMKEMIGQSFWDTDLSAKAYRYRLSGIKPVERKNTSYVREDVEEDRLEDLKKSLKSGKRSFVIDVLLTIYMFYNYTPLSFFLGIVFLLFSLHTAYCIYRINKAIRLYPEDNGIAEQSFLEKIVVTVSTIAVYVVCIVVLLFEGTTFGYVVLVILLLFLIISVMRLVNLLKERR